MSSSDPQPAPADHAGHTPHPAPRAAAHPAPQYAQPEPPPQYAQPVPAQYAPPIAQPSTGTSASTATAARPATGSLNVPGIIALAVLALSSATPLLTPFILRGSFGIGSAVHISLLFAVLNGGTLLIAGVLAIVGLTSKRMTRWRWAAIGAAVATALGLLSLLLSLLGAALAAAIPF